MKKHLLKVIGILAISASAYAIAPDLMGPPGTEGIGQTGSNTEVRVTANVVAGIAVNEASPIDFGNLVRGKGIYQADEIISENTPGIVTFRGGLKENGTDKVAEITATLEKNKIDLHWKSANGSNGNGKVEVLKNITVTGLSTTGETITLDKNGQAKRTLHAWFKAYDNGSGGQDQDNGNLGQNQRLGSYYNSVIVSARYK